jgi:hypothetical protein
MENEKHYFAYGSNINRLQMAYRCPQAKIVGNGFIENYKLQFKKYATITPQENARVPVLVWKLNQRDEAILDRFEGVPNSYRKQNIEVEIGGKIVTGMTYIMSKMSPEISPSAEYYKRILDGYRQAGFDTAYLDNAVNEAKFSEANREKLYIAYGANLNQNDMKYRCPDAKIVTVGEIPDYQLQFKGCATIAPQKGFTVPIMMWKISSRDELNLDRFESYPSFYRKEFFEVGGGGNNAEKLAMAYIMNGNQPQSSPSRTYFNTILKGYQQAGFDENVLYEAAERAYNQQFRQEQDFEEEPEMEYEIGEQLLLF